MEKTVGFPETAISREKVGEKKRKKNSRKLLAKNQVFLSNMTPLISSILETSLSISSEGICLTVFPSSFDTTLTIVLPV